jgi:2-iminobutanoate/2-iminopropanoate deaminase
MTYLQFVNSDSLGMPGGHYSHSAIAGTMVFISGQLPITADGHKLIDESFDTQVGQVFDNLEQVLLSCGCNRNHLLQVRIYLCDVNLWSRFDQLYAEWMGAHRPARCVVPVPALHYGLSIEIEAVAQQPAIEK